MPYVTSPYRLQVGDVLDIRLVLNPELNEEVTIRPDGHISTTISHDIVAGGLTVPELDAALTADYGRDLVNPRISVIVKTFAPTVIYVAGEVVKPGEISSSGTAPTLSQAIASAGGTKLSGDETKVFIIRYRGNQSPEFLSTRYDELCRGQDPTADVRLAPFDVVFVPRSSIAEVYRWYNQHIQQFVSPNFDVNYLISPAAAATTLANPTK